ncbi:hypothetical protein BMS3Abin09_01254 [bacterium BMS3Abin09]|nr:hypothetical protein BMS3Abin09_01254 [bacterium BMS3Abin09]
MDFSPSLFMITISPGSTSRIYLAPIRSKAHVSDATTYDPSTSPMLRGLNPNGSRIANSSSSVISRML